MALSAREETLSRIRTAIGETAAGFPDQIDREWSALPRTYRRSGTLAHDALLELLEDRLRDYDAHVVRTTGGAVNQAIASMLAARGKRRLLIPRGLADLLGGELPPGFQFVVDDELALAEIETFDGIVTASTLAIAETGTIVLQNVPGQGRRAPTLVPDYHLCLVAAEAVVETVPEAFDRLAATATLATTFISGPSATADIEMTRIKGVHGPRFLDVLLVG